MHHEEIVKNVIIFHFKQSPNQDVHFMAREIDEWMPQGIKSLIAGSYSPRLLKRYYFSDGMVDQLHV